MAEPEIPIAPKPEYTPPPGTAVPSEVQEWRREIRSQYPSDRYHIEWTQAGAVIYSKPSESYKKPSRYTRKLLAEPPLYPGGGLRYVIREVTLPTPGVDPAQGYGWPVEGYGYVSPEKVGLPFGARITGVTPTRGGYQVEYVPPAYTLSLPVGFEAGEVYGWPTEKPKHPTAQEKFLRSIVGVGKGVYGVGETVFEALHPVGEPFYYGAKKFVETYQLGRKTSTLLIPSAPSKRVASQLRKAYLEGPPLYRQALTLMWRGREATAPIRQAFSLTVLKAPFTQEYVRARERVAEQAVTYPLGFVRDVEIWARPDVAWLDVEEMKRYPGLFAGQFSMDIVLGKYVLGPAVSKAWGGVKWVAGKTYRLVPSHARYVVYGKKLAFKMKTTIPFARKVTWPVKYKVGHLWRGSRLQQYLRPTSYKIWGIEEAFSWTKEAPTWFIGLSGVPEKLIPRLALQYSFEAHQTFYTPMALKAYGKEKYILAMMRKPSYRMVSFLRAGGVKHLYASWVRKGRPVYHLEKRVEGFVGKSRYGEGKRVTRFEVSLEKTITPKTPWKWTTPVEELAHPTREGQTLASQTIQQTQKELPTLTAKRALPTVSLVKEYAQAKTIAKSFPLSKVTQPPSIYRMAKSWATLGPKIKPYPKVAPFLLSDLLSFMTPKREKKVKRKREITPIITPRTAFISLEKITPTPKTIEEQTSKATQQVAQISKTITRQMQAQQQIETRKMGTIQETVIIPPTKEPTPPHLTFTPPRIPMFRLPKYRDRRRQESLFGRWFRRTHPIVTAKQMAKTFGLPYPKTRKRRKTKKGLDIRFQGGGSLGF